MPVPRFNSLTISDLRRETANAVSLAVAVPKWRTAMTPVST